MTLVRNILTLPLGPNTSTAPLQSNHIVPDQHIPVPSLAPLWFSSLPSPSKLTIHVALPSNATPLECGLPLGGMELQGLGARILP